MSTLAALKKKLPRGVSVRREGGHYYLIGVGVPVPLGATEKAAAAMLARIQGIAVRKNPAKKRPRKPIRTSVKISWDGGPNRKGYIEDFRRPAKNAKYKTVGTAKYVALSKDGTILWSERRPMSISDARRRGLLSASNPRKLASNNRTAVKPKVCRRNPKAEYHFCYRNRKGEVVARGGSQGELSGIFSKVFAAMQSPVAKRAGITEAAITYGPRLVATIDSHGGIHMTKAVGVVE